MESKVKNDDIEASIRCTSDRKKETILKAFAQDEVAKQADTCRDLDSQVHEGDGP